MARTICFCAAATAANRGVSHLRPAWLPVSPRRPQPIHAARAPRHYPLSATARPTPSEYDDADLQAQPQTTAPFSLEPSVSEPLGSDELAAATAGPPQAVDAASATARAIMDDVAANPEYYLNVSGVLLGLTLSFVVLSATVVALDSLPVVPDLLRMVGLVYLFWFLAKFLFNSSERARLGAEVQEFVDGVRGGEFRVLGEAPSTEPAANSLFTPSDVPASKETAPTEN